MVVGASMCFNGVVYCERCMTASDYIYSGLSLVVTVVLVYCVRRIMRKMWP